MSYQLETKCIILSRGMSELKQIYLKLWAALTVYRVSQKFNLLKIILLFQAKFYTPLVCTPDGNISRVHTRSRMQRVILSVLFLWNTPLLS